ncbi:MAG: hypothetical protein IK084_04040 [Bacteroidaceae bacterium]|nr:hypothetical protein [Bacteroidaceae bacterium]
METENVTTNARRKVQGTGEGGAFIDDSIIIFRNNVDIQEDGFFCIVHWDEQTMTQMNVNRWNLNTWPDTYGRYYTGSDSINIISVHAEFEGTLSLNMQATVKVTFNYKRWYTEWNEVEHKLDTIIGTTLYSINKCGYGILSGKDNNHYGGMGGL